MGERISDNMLRILRLARDSKPLDTGTHGRAERGGLTSAICALQRRGMLHGDRITDAGMHAIAAAENAREGG